MQVVEKDIHEICEYANNPRNNEPAVDKVMLSIKEFGFKVPIIIDKDNVIVAGHTRLKAAKQLGLKTVPVIVADDLNEEQVKAFRLADNKVSEFAEWDFSKLEMELSEIEFDMSAFGFEIEDFEDVQELDKPNSGVLVEKYIEPPFSILDTRQGRWQDRKRIWNEMLKSSQGRDDGLLGDGLKKLAMRQGSNLTGTSIFDPVLCELLITWFCPKGAKIIDPFAGGSVRGVVSAMLGNSYTGVDLSTKQVDANKETWKELNLAETLEGGEIVKPQWINDDSRNIDKIIDGEFDFLLTCPPYADLEVYSNDERDISNMSYGDFVVAYEDILKKAFDKLSDNAYAAIVVGEVRDKKGYYYNFVGDTIRIAKENGLQYYNECILIEAGGTAALRADKQFSAKRKVVKTHQNVLIFLKGDETKINLEKYEYNLSDFEEVG